MMRFYKEDVSEYERLISSPGGWHNTLERLYENAALNHNTKIVRRKTAFTTSELLASTY